MPAMKSMAGGAALATYDNGGCRDYARDGETALVAPTRTREVPHEPAHDELFPNGTSPPREFEGFPTREDNPVR
jgi:hypothetical protein